MKIAIVGAGIAGLSAASFLCRDGHDARVFECFDAPRPVGAGLLIQPTGLAMLARLGLGDAAIRGGSRIDHLYGRSSNGRVVFDVSYSSLSSSYHGVGMHRAVLFDLLHGEALRLGVPIVTDTEIKGLHYDSGLPLLTDARGQVHGPFDLVVDAHGIRSCLRTSHGAVKMNRPYPFGAVWGICRDESAQFPEDTLTQRYHLARKMAGVLPVGRLNGDSVQSVAFFWSLPRSGHQDWRDRGMEAWRAEVAVLWPEAATLVAQFETPSSLSFATYSDVVLHRPFAHRLAFIGDAAHCTSPQLGQGANLALADACVLAESLRTEAEIDQALKVYARRRHGPVSFYQTASRWLTPYFQSHSRVYPVIRDHAFPLMGKVPYTRREMLRTLSGVKTGLFTHREPV